MTYYENVETEYQHLLQYYTPEELHRYANGDEDAIRSLYEYVQPVEIEIGDLMGVSENSNESYLVSSPDGYVPVLDCVHKIKEEMYTVTFSDGTKIDCSHDHLFQEHGGKWVYARDMFEGQKFISDHSSSGTTAIDIEVYIESTDVYDLSVGHHNHRYYTAGVCSHNTGKSLFLQNHSVYHAMDNKEVLQITLELHPELVARRMYSMLLDKSTKDLYADMNNVAAEIVLKLKKAKAGNVQIKYMPSGSSTADIKNLVKMYMNDTGKKVDILIIDYLDLVSPVAKVSVGDTFNKDKHVSEELRNIGQELGPVVITASQINRGGNGLDELDHTHIAGGISKINTADLVIGIITNNAMREKGMYEIQIMKARNSQGTGRKIPLLINTNTMKIFDDPDFLASINSYMKMSTAQANQSRHDSEVSKTINELQNALNKDSTDYTEVDPETGEPVEDQQNDDRFSQIQALINRNSKG